MKDTRSLFEAIDQLIQARITLAACNTAQLSDADKVELRDPDIAEVAGQLVSEAQNYLQCEL